MPVQLHERLSEFSYGYGVTREVEIMLQSEGLAAVPFLPSLLHEAELGFDVGFNCPGEPILLQFKLGEAMRRFHPSPRPHLDQSFWRFKIDTAERDGQFELLLKAEDDGADVFYIAPKFHDWEIYLQAFERREILSHSCCVRPSTIRQALDYNGLPDGEHKIVYDTQRAYLCSHPYPIDAFHLNDLARKVRLNIQSQKRDLSESLERVYSGLSERASIRREPSQISKPFEQRERFSYAIPSDTDLQSDLRAKRLERLLSRAPNRETAIALAVGAEAWSSGAQLLYVTVP